MRLSEFRKKVIDAIPAGYVMDNPGGGITTIVAYSESNITYRRGNSKIVVSFGDLHDALLRFRGGVVDSSRLKDYKPNVFGSRQSGHSCNCTFFFMVLKEMGIVESIDGEGKKGSPFRIYIPG